MLLVDLDSMVQRCISGETNQGVVITRAGGVSTAKALLKKYLNVVQNIDLDSSSWAKCLFTQMGFVLRKFTSAKVDISDKARKQIEYQYHYEIVSKVKHTMEHTMELKGGKNIAIAGATETSQPHLQSPYEKNFLPIH